MRKYEILSRIGFIMFFIGISAMDSENMIVPIMMTLTGLMILVKSSIKLEKNR